MLPVAMGWLGHPVMALQYVMYFRFCWWVRIKDDVYFLSGSPGGSTRGEVCRIRLHLVLSLSVVQQQFVCCSSSSHGTANVLDVSKEFSQGSSLNYAKIKSDLASPGVHYQTRGLLLQALRWVSLPAENKYVEKFNLHLFVVSVFVVLILTVLIPVVVIGMCSAVKGKQLLYS